MFNLMNLYYSSYNKDFILNLPTNFSIEMGEFSMLYYKFFKIRIQIMKKTKKLTQISPTNTLKAAVSSPSSIEWIKLISCLSLMCGAV